MKLLTFIVREFSSTPKDLGKISDTLELGSDPFAKDVIDKHVKD